jgi:hypothetical protein
MGQKTAKLTQKGGKLAKVCTACSKFFFLHTKKFVLQKIAFAQQK